MFLMVHRILAFAAALPLLAQNPVTDALKSSYNRMKQNLIETADVMPEADYGFKLTPQQREFGQWLGHTAMGNYIYCATIRGATPPDAMKSIEGLSSKADVAKALKDSFDYCDGAVNSLTDQKATAEIPVGDRKMYPVTPFVSLVASLNEHYGNLVGYLRSKGIVPPSTARATRSKK
jgi:hypothetical protein